MAHLQNKVSILTFKLFLYIVISPCIFSSIKSTAQSQIEYNWKSVQINAGGLVSGVIFNSSEQGLVYARTDIGGSYRWDNANREWIALTDHITRAKSQHMGVLSIATDPIDPDRVYAAVGMYTPTWGTEAAILASNNRGETWTEYPIASGVRLGGNENGRTTGERLQVDPNKNNILFLGTSNTGVYKSINYGANWAKITTFPTTTTNVSFILFDKSSSTLDSPTPVIYAGVLRNSTTTNKNLYKSTDGGDTWVELPNQPLGARPHHAELASDGNLYVTYSNSSGPGGATSGFVYKYDGTTWTNITPPTPSGYCGSKGYAGLSVSATDPNYITVSSLNCWWPHEMIFRSTNGGTNWTEVCNTNATYDMSSAPYAAASTPHWVGDIDIDPFDKNNVWFITGYGLWHTEGFGNTTVPWAFDNVGIEETAALELIAPPTGAPLLSAIGDIDGFKHDNLDISPPQGRFSTKGTNRSIAFAENNPSFMVKAFDASPFGSYSINGGTSWIDFTGIPIGANAAGKITVNSDGTRIVWRPAGDGTTFYSTNNGTTWTASTGIASNVDPVADRVNPLKFYAYDASAGRFYVSTDGGENFTNTVTTLPVIPSWDLWNTEITAVPEKEGHIWLAGYVGGLHYSTNSGVSFTKIINIGLSHALKIAFGKKETSSTYPTIYIVGTMSSTEGFFRSVDMGSSWVRINDNEHQYGSISDIAADPNVFGRVYIAAGGRGIIYGDDLTTTSIEEASKNLQTLEINIYPNPSKNSFSVKTKNSISNSSKLEILTIFGQQLMNYHFENSIQNVGEDLASGIYYFKITNGEYIKTLKVIKE